MTNTHTEAATGAAVLKEMVDVANSSASWVRTTSASVQSLAAYVHHLKVTLEASILAHKAWPVQIEALEAKNKAMREALSTLVQDLDYLIGDSGGVYGLHLNDDPAPWDSITAGGAYEEHLASLEGARAALQGKATS